MGLGKLFKRSFVIGMTSLTLLCVVNPVQVEAASWKKNQTGWWWQEDDGSWPASQWKRVSGKWYYFNSAGYMTRGWQQIDGKWYYMNSSGAMTTGWQRVGGKWYYMDASGAMTTGWQRVGGKWYYMNASGAMTTGWQRIGGKWYYMNSSGAMLGSGWHWIGGKCYYMDSSGAMAADTWIGNYYVDSSGAWVQSYQPAHWIKSGNRWWYRHADGSYTRNNWETIAGKKYYFDGSGWMKTGWLNSGNNWYYLDSSGAMQTNQWIGDYYVGSDGKMAVNQWIDNKYVNASGKWDKNKKPEHVHNWVEQTVTIHHDAEGYEEEYVVKDAWTEERQLYIDCLHSICTNCGFDLTQAYIDTYGMDEYASAFKGTFTLSYYNENTGYYYATGESITLHGNQKVSGKLNTFIWEYPHDPAADPADINYDRLRYLDRESGQIYIGKEIFEKTNSWKHTAAAWYTDDKLYSIPIKKETVTHPAELGTRWVETKPAWDEILPYGRKCSECGQIEK